MEQTQYKLLFRWFIGLYIDDTVCWVPTVSTTNPERLIEHDAVIGLINAVLAIANENAWLDLSGFFGPGLTRDSGLGDRPRS